MCRGIVCSSRKFLIRMLRRFYLRFLNGQTATGSHTPGEWMGTKVISEYAHKKNLDYATGSIHVWIGLMSRSIQVIRQTRLIPHLGNMLLWSLLYWNRIVHYLFWLETRVVDKLSLLWASWSKCLKHLHSFLLKWRKAISERSRQNKFTNHSWQTRITNSLTFFLQLGLLKKCLAFLLNLLVQNIATVSNTLTGEEINL